MVETSAEMEAYVLEDILEVGCFFVLHIAGCKEEKLT